MAFDGYAFFVRFANAFNVRDLTELERLIHPDFVSDIPQSGERSRGIKGFMDQVDMYPGGQPEVPLDTRVLGDEERWAISPAYTVVPLTAPNEFTIVSKVQYPDGKWWIIVGLIELRDEKLYRMENYFAPELPAPLAESIASFPRS